MSLPFLTRHGMAAHQVDIPLTCERFLGEMSAGLAGMPSSVLMLPTYLSAAGTLPHGVSAAVIDAGGTNARVAKVTFTAQGPQVEHLERFPIPGLRHRVSGEDFLASFAQHLLPFIRECAAIGFCFSFPARITPERDGQVLYFDKEIQVDHPPDFLLVRTLTDLLRRQGVPNLRGVVLNDTVAALLGGAAQSDPRQYDGYLGLVYGTGINTCYAETADSLSGLSPSWGPSMLINTESGGFSRVPSGDFDLRTDVASRDPGRHLYEKMVAGAYLGEVIRHTLAGAAQEGLLPQGFSLLEKLTTQEADAFAVAPMGDNPLARLCQTEDHRRFVYDVVDQLTLRAARLVCANLAALLIRSGLGKSRAHPACIVAEGSTLYESKLLLPYLQQTMAEYVGGRLGLSYTFLRPENANLTGAAAAALLNR